MKTEILKYAIMLLMVCGILYLIKISPPPELCFIDLYSGGVIVDTKVMRCDTHDHPYEGIYYKNTGKRAN